MQLSKANAILLGVLASLFFATTFVLNRLMSLKGGSWIWSSSLRFYWMLPFFILIVMYRRNLIQVISEIKLNPVQWSLWSIVGLGPFMHRSHLRLSIVRHGWLPAPGNSR